MQVPLSITGAASLTAFRRRDENVGRRQNSGMSLLFAHDKLAAINSGIITPISISPRITHNNQKIQRISLPLQIFEKLN